MTESGASSRTRARRRRTAITMALLVLVLFLAFWYAYSYYRGSNSKPRQAAAPTCPKTTSKKGLSPKSITVNVYNATNRTGLAASTAKLMRARGYTVSTITNDPLKKTVTAPAEVRYGKSGAAGAKQVAALVKGVKLLHDGRQDTSVDLVLGEGFTALAPAAKSASSAAPATC